MERKKKKFKLFDMNRDGKGVVEENQKPTFAFFFKSLFRKFPQLLRLNLLMLFQILPIIFFVLVFLLGNKVPSPTSTLFAPLFGIDQALSTPGAAQMLDMSSLQMELPVFSTLDNFILIFLALFLAITWGWQNVGSTYVLRGLVRGDAVFVFSDYFYAIKRNLKQGFIFGLIDFTFCAVLIIDLLFFNQITGQSFGVDFMFFVILALIVVYVMMRFYLYNLLITFDMKNFKIIKNSFIFSILGIKRNVLALFGIIIFVALHVLLIFFLLPTPLGFVIILPLIYALAVTAFMGTYAAYPIIDKYLIAPYAKEDEEEFIYLKPDDSSDKENDTEQN